MSPDCGCGIDQDDRADINPKPGVGSDLSHQPKPSHGSPSPVFQAFLNPVILVNTAASLQKRPFTLIKPRLQSLLGSQASNQKRADSSQALQKVAEIALSLGQAD